MFDVIIIGGGVVGASVAAHLSKKKGKFLLLEKNEDVCTETTKANSGICHGGYDAVPGTLKAKFNVLGNQMMEEESKLFVFPYKKIGTLVLCHDEKDMPNLQKLYDYGIENGVKGMKILNREETLALEKNITEDVVASLYCAEAGILDPFLMNIAYAEVSNINGVDYKFNTKVEKIERADDHFLLHTNNGDFETKAVINCAGIYSDELHNQISDEKYQIKARRGEYLLLDKETAGFVKHVMFNLPTEKGKGILVSPTIDNNTLVGPTSDFVDDKSDRRSTRERLEEVIEKSNHTVKDVPVPATSSMTVSPMATGALMWALFISSITSMIFPFGTASSVLTDTEYWSDPSTLAVDVTVLTGFVSSFFAYTSPLLQVLPVMFVICPSSTVTLTVQPRGQFMQVNSLIISSPILLRFFRCFHLGRFSL